jgi:hypothetical protein
VGGDFSGLLSKKSVTEADFGEFIPIEIAEVGKA